MQPRLGRRIEARIIQPMLKRWRILQSAPADGATNMAVDQAILEAVAAGSAPPTLRVYAWEPPCLSLGYAQPLDDIDLPRLAAAGWDWVRRPTGGRAILHTDELTYAVIAPERHPLMTGGVLASYRRLSSGLLAGLSQLGVEAEVEPNDGPRSGRNQNPVCFEVPSAYEIKAAGRKLIGSAQVRRLGAVLQHGTLPLGGDLGRICHALAFDTQTARQQAAERVRQRAATLEELLGRPVAWSQAAQALVLGFEQAMGSDLEPGTLSPAEQARVRQWARQLSQRPGEAVGRVDPASS